MCGGGDNVYGIVAGLVGASAMLVLAFAEKHGGEHAHTAAAPPAQIVSSLSVDAPRNGNAGF